jgi:hypothetical protein
LGLCEDPLRTSVTTTDVAKPFVRK